MKKSTIFIIFILISALIGCQKYGDEVSYSPIININEEEISQITVKMLPSPPTTYIVQDKEDIVSIVEMLKSFSKNIDKISSKEKTNGWEILFIIEEKETIQISFAGEHMYVGNSAYFVGSEKIEEIKNFLNDLNLKDED